MTDAGESPRGELQLRTLAMPADTNPAGDIFGGWLLSQMDIAGSLSARVIAHGRTATVAVDSMTFHLPVFVGDAVCCYVEVEKIGRSSITTLVQAWAMRGGDGVRVKVTEGRFIYVAIGPDRKPRPITPETRMA